MGLFLTVRVDQTIYIELPAEASCDGVARRLEVVLREKRGRTAKLEFVAGREIFVDVRPRARLKGVQTA